MEQKSGINKAVGDKRAEGQEMKNQLAKMKKSIGYNSEVEIDERIATIEYEMTTGSLTLKQEKEFLKEISELKKTRPKVAQVNKMQESLSTRDTGANLKESIGTINEQMAMYR